MLLLSAMALVLLPIIAFPAGCVALVLVLDGAWSSSRAMRRVTLSCAIAAGVDVVAAAPAVLAEFAARSKAVFELTGPREIDSIVFPAGSVVVTEGGRVSRGTLGAATMIAGLTLVGRFGMHAPGRIAYGELATAGLVDGVPCGPGNFSRLDGNLRCTLAQPFTLNAAALAAGHEVKIRLGRDGAPATILSGVLLEPARIGGLVCAPGKAAVSELSELLAETRCLLAHDQEVMGFWLQGGTEHSIYRKPDGRSRLGPGMVLAQPIEAFGATVPAGTSIKYPFPDVTAEELREGRLPRRERARFRTPCDSVVPFLGGEVHGAMDVTFYSIDWRPDVDPNISIRGTSVEVSGGGNGDNVPCTSFFLLNGQRAERAIFDRSSGTWVYTVEAR